MTSIVLTEDDITAKSHLRVKKSVSEVFNAVVQPEQMCNYFISASTGPLTPGAKVTWTWGDFNASGPVEVLDFVENEKLAFVWGPPECQTRVDMQFIAIADDVTLIKVRELCGPNDANILKAVKRQAYGWTHLLFLLKVFLELGVNLRPGSIDPSDMA
jgi:uncharacterized protein YndB with AHSA1/START domain